MFGNCWPGNGFLVAMLVLALIGLGAIIAGAWWLVAHIGLVWVA